MATDRDWAKGFLEQARAELEIAESLVRSREGLTTRRAAVLAMLLQMAFEKFAKAALLRSGEVTYLAVRQSHKASSRMIATMRRHRRLAPIGGPNPWEKAFEVVEGLERAHPSLTQGGPQLEYPWQDASGAVRWPARDLPIAQKLSDPQSTLAGHIITFAMKLEQRFDAIFPP